jgi:2-oxoglutarate ferredoxin oxidoreductase subunit alpha
MPTYTEQGELLFIAHAGHGEFARIVLAPGDAQEAFELTRMAFELADRYQLPVFVLSDKYLNESQWSVPVSVLKSPWVIDRGKLITGDTGFEDGKFLRYDPTVADGVSPRSIPGTKNGVYYANSYEHDGTGHVTDDADARVAMVDKRMRKIESMKKDIIAPHMYGDADADITLLCWGSTKGAVVTAAEMMRAQGKKVSVMYMNWLFPMPEDTVRDMLQKAKRVIDIEQNATGQLAILIRELTGFDVREKILKYDGRPFLPEEIIERIQA